MKPTIGLDCDGVLSDFDGYARPIANARLGTNYTRDDITAWSWRDCLGPEADAICREVIADGTCYAQMGSFPGVADLMRRLAERYRVVIVTQIAERFRAARHQWLRERDIAFDRLICADRSTSKPEIARAMGMVAFVEDNLATATALCGAVPTSYLVDQPWNRSGRCPALVCGTLEQIVDALMAV